MIRLRSLPGMRLSHTDRTVYFHEQGGAAAEEDRHHLQVELILLGCSSPTFTDTTSATPNMNRRCHERGVF